MAVSMGAVGDSLAESQDEPEDLFIDEDDCMDIDMDDIRLLDDIDNNTEKSPSSDGVLSPDSDKRSSATSSIDMMPSTTQKPDGTLTLFSENLQESVVIRANKVNTEEKTGDSREIYTLTHLSKETDNSAKEKVTIPSSSVASNDIISVKNLSDNVVSQTQSNVNNDSRKEPVSDIHDIKLVAPKRKNVKSPLKVSPTTSKKTDKAPAVVKIKSEPIEFDEPVIGINDITEVDMKPFQLQTGKYSKQDLMPTQNNQPLHKIIPGQNSKPLIAVQHSVTPESGGQLPVPSVSPRQTPVTHIQSRQQLLSVLQSQLSSVSGIQPGQLSKLLAQKPGLLQTPVSQPGQQSTSASSIQPEQLSKLLAVQPGPLQTPVSQPGQLQTPVIFPGQLSASAINIPPEHLSKLLALQKPGLLQTPVSQPGQLQTPVIHPGQLSASAVQPGQLSAPAVQPRQQSASAIQPRLQSASAIQPGQQSTSAVQPGQLPISTFKPGQLPTSAISLLPGQSSLLAGQPGHLQTPVIHPGHLQTSVIQPGKLSVSAISIKPGQSLLAVQPGHLQTPAIQPGQLSTSAVQPGQQSTSAIKHGQLSASAIQPNQLSVNDSLTLCPRIISTPASDTRQMLMNSQQNNQLQVSGIESRQPRIPLSAAIVQPAPPTIRVEQPGQVSVLQPGMVPIKVVHSPKMQTQIPVPPPSTSNSVVQLGQIPVTAVYVGQFTVPSAQVLQTSQPGITQLSRSNSSEGSQRQRSQLLPTTLSVFNSLNKETPSNTGHLPLKVSANRQISTSSHCGPVTTTSTASVAQLSTQTINKQSVKQVSAVAKSSVILSKKDVSETLKLKSKDNGTVDRDVSRTLKLKSKDNRTGDQDVSHTLKLKSKDNGTGDQDVSHTLKLKSKDIGTGDQDVSETLKLKSKDNGTGDQDVSETLKLKSKDDGIGDQDVSHTLKLKSKDNGIDDQDVSDEEDTVDEHIPMTEVESEKISDKERVLSSTSPGPSASSSATQVVIRKPSSLLQLNVDLNPKVVLKKLQEKDLQLLQRSSADAKRNLWTSKPPSSESVSRDKLSDISKVTSREYPSRSADGVVLGGSCWQCYACNNEFCSKTDMLYHIQISHSYYTNKGTFSCTHCGKSHTSLEEAILHEKLTHSLKFSCCFCGRQQANMTALQIHVCNHIHPLTYLCMLCREDFSTVQLAEKHITMHKGEVAFWTDFLKCRFCGSLFSKRHRLYHHVLVTHSNLFRHKCKSCSQMFYGELALLLHRSDKDRYLDGKKIHVQENVELNFDMSSEKVSQEMIDISDDECDDSSSEKMSPMKPSETSRQPSASQGTNSNTKALSQVAATVSQVKNKWQFVEKDLNTKPPATVQKEDGSTKTLEFCIFALIKMTSVARDDLLQQSVSFVGKINNDSHSLLTKVYKQKFHLVSHLKTEMDSIMEVIKKDCIARNPNDIPSYAKNERIFIKVFPLLQKQISFDNQDDNTEKLGLIIGEFFGRVKEVLTSRALKVTVEKEHNPIAVQHYKDWNRFLSQLITSHWDCVKNLVMGGLNRDSVAFLPKVSEIRKKKVAILNILESEMQDNKSGSAENATPAISDKKDNSALTKSVPADKERNLEKSAEGSLSSVMSEAEKKAELVSKLNTMQESNCKFSLAYISKEYVQNSLPLQEQLEKNVSRSPVNTATPVTSQDNLTVKRVVTTDKPDDEREKVDPSKHKPDTERKTVVQSKHKADTERKTVGQSKHKANAETEMVDLGKCDQSKSTAPVINLESDEQNADDNEIVSVNDNDDDDNTDMNQVEDVSVSNSVQESKQSESTAEGLLLDCEEESSDLEEENDSPVKLKTSSAKVVLATTDTVEEDSNMILDCQCVKIEPNIDGDDVDLTLMEDDEDVKSSSLDEDKDQEADRDEENEIRQGEDGENNTELDKNQAESNTIDYKVIKAETTEADDAYNITLAEDFAEKEQDNSTHVSVKREITEDTTPGIGENGTFPSDQPPPHKKLKLVQIFGSDVQRFSVGERSVPEARNLSGVASAVLPTQMQESDEQDNNLDTAILKKFYQ